MKILLINKFLYPKGGDAIYTLSLGAMLKSKGHEVYYWGMEHPENRDFSLKNYFVSNIDYHKNLSIKEKLKISFDILYSFESKNKIDKVLRIIKPDIVHLNNFAHQISPSILHVFYKNKIPAVMTMHDYKLICPTYTLLSNGKICEKCKGGKFYNCLINKCTKDSYFKSFINTLEMYLHHKIMHIYDLINVFISPSIFLKNKLIEWGFKGKIEYIPNFVNLEKFTPQYEWKGNNILYFGRISQEKGLETLINAVKEINKINLLIVGKGPLEEKLKETVKSSNIKNVNFLGYKTHNELIEIIKNSMFVVLPSECYENSPLSILESFSTGKPVIGSNLGGIPELVIDNHTGFIFKAGDHHDLANKIKQLSGNKELIIKMGKNSRNFIEKELNFENYYKSLIKVYEKAMNMNK